MTVQAVTITPGVSYLLKLVGETTLDIFSVDFATGVFTSSVLPSSATAALTAHLQSVYAGLSSAQKAALFPDGFAGLVRSLFGLRQLEGGSTVSDPGHVMLDIPFSWMPVFNPLRRSIWGGGGLNSNSASSGGGGGDDGLTSGGGGGYSTGTDGGGPDLVTIVYDPGTGTATGTVTTYFVGCVFDAWTPGTSMPEARTDAAGANGSGLPIYVFGGLGAIAPLLSVLQYEADGSFTALADMPASTGGLGRYLMAVGTNSNQYMLCGGRDSAGNAVADVALYQAGPDTWASGAPMSLPLVQPWLSDVSLVGGPGTLRVGGQTFGGGATATAETYDGGTDTWTPAAAMNAARRNFGLASFTGHLIAIGGINNAGTTLATCETTPFALGGWTLVSSMPIALSDFGLTTLLDGRIMVIGGKTAAGTPSARCFLYNGDTDTWTETGTMAVARYFTGTSGFNGISNDRSNQIVAFGGFGASDIPSTAVEIYSELTHAWTTQVSMNVAHGGGILSFSPTDPGACGSQVAMGGRNAALTIIATTEIGSEV